LVLLFSCQPHPLYGPFHYARPGPLLQQRTLNPSSSSSDEVGRPNYSTVTEVTTMTTSEVVIRRANQENIKQFAVSILYTKCKFPQRNYSTRCITVYEHPVMTTAIALTPVREIGWRSEYTSTRCAFSNTVNAVDNHFLWRPNQYRQYLSNTDDEIELQRSMWISNFDSARSLPCKYPPGHMHDMLKYNIILLGFTIDWFYLCIWPAISRSQLLHIMTDFYIKISYPARRCLGQRFVFLIKLFVKICIICCIFILTVIV